MNANNKVLQVNATGVEKLPATLAKIALGVTITGPEAGKVQNQLRERNNKVMAFLRKQKVDDLKTQNYQIQTKTSYSSGKRKDEGFEGRSSIHFSVPIDRAGELLDSIIKNGANQIKSIQFTATPKELAEAENRALTKASQNALAKGKHVLKSLDLSFVEIDEVVVGYHQPAPRNQRNLMFARESASADVAIEGGDVQVEAQVTLVLKYK